MSNKKKQPRKGKALAVADGGEVAEGGERTLTDKQAAFVAAYTDGETAGNATKSARKAGYSQKTAHGIACALLKLPHVIAAIDATMRETISTRLTVKAVGVFEAILNSADATLKLKGEVASKVIEFSGLVERTKAQKAKDTGLSGGKTLAECSRAELEDIVRKGAAVLQAAASLPAGGTVIEGDSAQDNAQRPALAAE
jgi:hypothetical protein